MPKTQVLVKPLAIEALRKLLASTAPTDAENAEGRAVKVYRSNIASGIYFCIYLIESG
jgi:hypothetical protein